jgi:phosphogluconate dehydratase
MSGASGKVLAAIHVTPEALDGGPLARVEDGDVIRVDAHRGELGLRVDAAALAARRSAAAPPGGDAGTGRELFALMRRHVGRADQGASFLFPETAP